VTTLDRKLARTMEPRAATPVAAAGGDRTLAQAGIPVSVMVAPVVPGLNDQEIERILDSVAYAAGRARLATSSCGCRSRSRRSSRTGCCATIPTATATSCR
jgi:DNA repair photolyase